MGVFVALSGVHGGWTGRGGYRQGTFSLGKEIIQVTAGQLLLLWRHRLLGKLGQLKLDGLFHLNSLSQPLPHRSLAKTGELWGCWRALQLPGSSWRLTNASGAGVCSPLESSRSPSHS